MSDTQPNQQPTPQQPCDPNANAYRQPVQQPVQPPYQAAGANAQPPYPPQQRPFGQQPYYQQEEKAVWPWIVAVCAALVVLIIASAVTTVAVARAVSTATSLSTTDAIAELFDDDSDLYDDGDGDDSDDSYGYDSDSSSYTYTFEQILALSGVSAGTATQNVGTEGAYIVGTDIDAGTYFLEGSQTGESYYYVFDAAGDDAYTIDDSVVYVGNYMTELQDGDVLVFLPADATLCFYPVESADFSPESPYESGLYRVGVDIPAGTYTISAQEGASDFTDNECAAYIMSDLYFDDDSITGTYYVMEGITQTITVEEGDYLELYCAVATPVEE